MDNLLAIDNWRRWSLFVRGRLHPLWFCSRSSNTPITDNWDVTVVVVVRDMKTTLLKALDSAATAIDHLRRCAPGGQLQAGILVLDDHSEDGSHDEAKAFAEASAVPMCILRTSWHVGLTRCRNLAWQAAHSQWLFFLDADNELVPEGLTRLHALALQYPEAAVAHGALRVWNAQGIPDDRMGVAAFDRNAALELGPLHDITALYNREKLADVGGFDERLLLRLWGFEDFDLWMRLSGKGHQIVHQPILVGRILRSSQGFWANRTMRSLDKVQEVFAQRFPGFVAYRRDLAPLHLDD